MKYIFNCNNGCGNFTVSIAHTELENIKECPKCKSTNIERVYSPTISVWKCGGNYGKSN